MNINELPYEVLFPILNYSIDSIKTLASTSLVCKLWNERSGEMKFHELIENDFFSHYPRNWKVIPSLFQRYRIENVPISLLNEEIETTSNEEIETTPNFNKYLIVNPFEKPPSDIESQLELKYQSYNLLFRIDYNNHQIYLKKNTFEGFLRIFRIINANQFLAAEEILPNFKLAEEVFLPCLNGGIQERIWGKIYMYRHAIIIRGQEPILIETEDIKLIDRSPREFWIVTKQNSIKKIVLDPTVEKKYIETPLIDFQELDRNESAENFEPQIKKQKIDSESFYKLLGVHGSIAAFLFHKHHIWTVKIIDLNKKSLLQKLEFKRRTCKNIDTCFNFPRLIVQKIPKRRFNIYEFDFEIQSFKLIVENLYASNKRNKFKFYDERFKQHEGSNSSGMHSVIWKGSQSFLAVDSEDADSSVYAKSKQELKNEEHGEDVYDLKRNFSRYLNVINLINGNKIFIDMPLDSIQNWLLWDHRLVLLKKHSLKIINLFNSHCVKFNLKDLMQKSAIRTIAQEMKIVKKQDPSHLELVLSTHNYQLDERIKEKVLIIPDVL